MSLIVLLPFVGLLVASIWMGVEVPTHHRRSPRWSALLVVPVVNYVGYWFYAFTLPRQDGPGGERYCDAEHRAAQFSDEQPV